MATEVSLPETPHIHQTPGPDGDLREQEISTLDLLIVWAERKRLILLITVAFAVVAALISLVLPKRYTATMTILPPQQNSSMGAALASQLGNLGGMAAIAGGSLGLKSPDEMLIAMMKSRTVEEGMIQKFGLMSEYHVRLMSDARKVLEKRATISAGGKDGLIHLSMEDGDANRAAVLANGYVDQFRNLSEHLAISEASQRRLFFEQQLQQARDNLEKAEGALKQTEQTTGLFQLDSQARALIESAATLRAQIAAKEVQIKSLETFATSQNSQLVQAQQELESLRQQLANIGGSGSGSDPGVIPSRGKVPEAGLEYVRKYRDVKYYETIFDILARQYEMAKLDEAREGALIQVVDPAAPPDRRSFPKRGMIVIGATFAGFFIGLVAAIIQAFLENMRRNSKNVLKLLRLQEALSLRRRA
jgi:tyrosine-protein kinase Etk/Wzc